MHSSRMKILHSPPCLDELFNLWNNAVCQINYWVCAAGRYRSASILVKVHKAFFNYHQSHANSLHARWDYLSKSDDSSRLGIWKSFTITWWRVWETVTMGYHPRSQCLSVYTLYSQQRPPSTQSTLPQPNAWSLPSHPDALEACHSKKGLMAPNL